MRGRPEFKHGKIIEPAGHSNYKKTKHISCQGKTRTYISDNCCKNVFQLKWIIGRIANIFDSGKKRLCF